MKISKLIKRFNREDIPLFKKTQLAFDSLESRLLLSVDLTHGPIGFDNGTPEVGEVINIMTDVYNIGDETLTDDFYVDFLANGTSLTNGQGFLITKDIPSGEKITVSKAYIYQGYFPDIEVNIDINDDIFEVAENNNSATESFTIPKADLAVTSLTHTENSNIKGESITYTATVQNLGPGGTVRDCSLSWYVNRGTGWTHVGSDRITSDFDVNDLTIKETETYSFTLDYDVTEIKAVIDTANEIDEINEWNNEVFDVISVEHPDLVVSEISWLPENPMDGQQVTFYANIDNIGTGGTTENFNVRFIVDYGMDSEYDLGKTRLTTTVQPYDILNPEVSLIAEVSRGAWTASPGNHTITVIVDCDNDISEVTTINNASSLVAGGTETSIEINDGYIRSSSQGAEMVFPVTLSQPTANTASVYYSTYDMTAIAGEDYVQKSGIIEFAPYETSTEIAILLTEYGFSAGDEFAVLLAGANYSSLANSYAYGTQTENNIPEAVDDNYRLTQIQQLTVDAADGVLSNDIDADGDYLSVSNPGLLVTAHGHVVLYADGSFVYTPGSSYSGSDYFIYTVTDHNDDSYDTGVVYITTKNTAPAAEDDYYQVERGSKLNATVEHGLLVNDSDIDGDAFAVSNPGTFASSHGQVELYSDGSFVYAPDYGYVGLDSFTYTITDNVLSNTDSAVVYISVTEENQSPVTVPDIYIVSDNSTLNVSGSDGLLANDYDPENSPLSIIGAGQYNTNLGRLEVFSDGSFRYISDNNSFGVDIVTLSLEDQFSSFELTNQVDEPVSVYAADLDNDGDMDLLSVSYNDDMIAWYENNGNGSFSTQKVISYLADGARSVYAADLDNDGDIDVLSASYIDDKIAWYENDGDGNFSIQIIITDQAYAASSVYAADLDNDGDMDVLAASYDDNKIAWYENTGKGSFTAQNIITDQADGAYCVYSADLDNDGDMDVLSASFNDDKITWYENDGTGSFNVQVITYQADGARSVYAADLDNDGDMDVLSASSADDKIAWYENNGTGTFNIARTITYQADGARSVYAADYDNDGDIDVVSASYNDDKIAWYENDGNGDFSSEKIITDQANGAYCVFAADLNNDGGMDIIFAARNGDNIIISENKCYIPYAVSDSISSPSAASLTLIVPPSQDNPVESIPAVKTDTGIRQIVGDVNSVYVSLLSYQQPAHGIAALENGSLHYISDSGYTGLDSFEYTLLDMQGDKITLTAYVQVAYEKEVEVSPDNPYIFTDSNNNKVTVKVDSGIAKLYFSEDTNVDIGKMVVLPGVSYVQIITAKEANTSIQQMDIQANLASLKASGLVVDGVGIYGVGSVASLDIGYIVNDADIILTGSGDIPAKVQLNVFGDNDGFTNTIMLSSGISSIKVNAMESDAELVADTLGTISSNSYIKGMITVNGSIPVKSVKAKTSISDGTWNLNCDIGTVLAKNEIDNLKIANVDNVKSIKAQSISELDIYSAGLINTVKAVDDIRDIYFYSNEIGSIKTAGWLRDGSIYSGGNIKSIKCGGIDGVELLAGVESTDNLLDSVPEIYLDDNAEIRSILVTGKAVDANSISTLNSIIAAGNIKKASLGSVSIVGDDRLLIGAVSGNWNPQKVKVADPLNSSIKNLETLANSLIETGQSQAWFFLDVI